MMGAPDLWALEPNRKIWHYGYAQWQDRDGLPQNTVQAIAQTRDGYIWLGTEAGLVRFNGRAFRTYTQASTPEMKSDSVLALLARRDGSLWVGTRSGLILRQGYASQRYGEGFVNETIRALAEDEAGNLWIGTNAGVTRLAAGQRRAGRFWRQADGLPDDGVRALYWHAGTLWIGTAQGLCLWRDGRIEAPPAPFPRDTVRALLRDREGHMWVGLEASGLFRLAGRGLTKLTRRDGLSSDSIRALAEDRDGQLWIATVGGGLNRWRQGQIDSMTRAQGMSSDHLRSLFEDREGNLWVGSEAGGLAQLKNSRALTYSFNDGFRSDFVRAVRGDRQGNLWVGTEGGGLHRLDASGRARPYDIIGMPGAFVTALCSDRRGNLWIGTEGNGAVRHGPAGERRFSTAAGLSENSVWAIEEDRDGVVWLGTSNGLVRVEGETQKVFRTADGLRGNSIRAMHAAKDGSLWIGTRTLGLQRRRGGRFEDVQVGESLRQAAFHAFAESDGQEIWLATSKGLGVWDGREARSLSGRQGVPQDALFQVLDDWRGTLWMTSSRGVATLKIAALRALLAGEIAKVEAQWITSSDGMKSSECSGDAQPAGWVGSEGDVWVPTIRGLVRVIGREGESHLAAPNVSIETVTVNGQPAKGPDFRSPPGNRLFSVQFAALTFQAPERVRIRYRLTDLDRDWIEAEGRVEAVYHGVPSGRYRFEVEAAQRGQDWTGQARSFDFEVLPYFYETAWFYGAAALAMAGGVYIWHRTRTRRLQREFAAVLGERTRIAREIHDTLLQGFAGANLQLASIRKRLGNDPAGEQLEGVLDQIERCLTEARQEIGELRGESSARTGLLDRLRETVRAAQIGMKVEVGSLGEARTLPAGVEKSLLRIAREAVGNAARHSKANVLQLRVEFLDRRIRLVAEDDGVGIADAEETAGHYGLVGMRERAQEAGGHFALTTEANKGTRIEVVLPTGEE